MSRRIVGAAKTKDIETLDPALREGAARGVLRTARAMIGERLVDSSPTHLAALAGRVLRECATR